MLVVPHGTGIGDMVNLAPLLRAIAAAHGGSRMFVLCDPVLAWLLPEGATSAGSVHGVGPWRRLDRNGLPGRGLARLSVPAAGRLLSPLVSRRTTRWMSGYLGRQEFPVVINLLETLTGLDRASDRWTRGPWQPERRHVIDLLAEALEAQGIAVPADRRVPRIEVTTVAPSPGPTALINPGSGSTLKEAPIELWVDVIRGLHDLGLRALVLGAPGTRTDPRLLAAAPDVRPIRMPLRELPPLIAGAAVVISPDTGILHLASAIGRPHVGIFGPTDPAFCGPYRPARGEVVETSFEHPPLCRGCWRAQMLPSARCPIFEPANCLSTISALAVIDAVQRVTGAPAGGPSATLHRSVVGSDRPG